MPPLALQVIQLVDSYMVWVGVAEGGPDDIQKASLFGNLCKDWACAMPAKDTNSPALATPLFQSTASGLAYSMGQRIAKRFQKQVFVSIDIPSGFGNGLEIGISVEKGIVMMLKRLEGL